jgi:general secretion pathway protein K
MPQRADDLIWLGLSPVSVSALRPHLVVLPGRLPVNLNTADAAVLQAVLDLPASAVAALIERRQARPIGSLEDSGLGERVDASRHAVASQFFEVTVRLESPQRWALHGRSLLMRQGRTVQILWRA